jgi:putative nucleotidyltransferase with HDIG domain
LPNHGSAVSASLFSQLTFLLHVPALFLAIALRDRGLLFDAIGRLRVQFGGVLEALLSLEEVSDTALRSHSQRHGELARSVAMRLGMPKDMAEEVFWAALLHDIGKLSLDREIFSLPRPLSTEEWALVRRHPTLGAKVLEGVPGLEKVITYVRYHHERWDGSGYPEGLRGESIPQGARIVALVDAFDAMVSARAYRRPRSLLDAVTEVRDQAGKHFDPAVVQAFFDILDEKGIPLPEVT